ncbi:hypothetical protein ES703_04761 [subsurface metagenome]
MVRWRVRGIGRGGGGPYIHEKKAELAPFFDVCITPPPPSPPRTSHLGKQKGLKQQKKPESLEGRQFSENPPPVRRKNSE